MVLRPKILRSRFLFLRVGENRKRILRRVGGGIIDWVNPMSSMTLVTSKVDSTTTVSTAVVPSSPASTGETLAKIASRMVKMILNI